MRIKVEELNDVHGKLKQIGNENDQLKNRVRQSEDMNRQLPEYEHQLSVVKNEIERLNNVLKGKVEECSAYETELRKYKY